jgi:hypothetical protein
MSALRKRLTYANVIATIALFLALTGGMVWAAGKIGSKRLKANSVTAGKIKRNAVTAAKIKPNAVTAAKIKAGAVSFSKLAAGTNVVAHGGGGAVPASSDEPVAVPLAGTLSFTPTTDAAYFLGVEAKGESLGRTGAEPCDVQVVFFLNGNRWDVAEGGLRLRAFAPTAGEPSGTLPITGGMAPIGLTSPGTPQTVSAKVFGDPDCTPASTVTAGFVVTQAK